MLTLEDTLGTKLVIHITLRNQTRYSTDRRGCTSEAVLREQYERSIKKFVGSVPARREILLGKSKMSPAMNANCKAGWGSNLLTRTHTNTLTGAAVSIFMKYVAVSAVALVHAVVEFVAELLARRSVPASSWNTAEKRGRE